MNSPMLIISLVLLSSSVGYTRKSHRQSNGVQGKNQIDDGIGKFGIDLHANVLKYSMGSGDNVLVSPIGVYLSLALAHLATDGQTRDELKKVMGLPMDEKLTYKSHQIIGELYRHMQHCQHTNVSIYNGLFMQTGNTIKSTYSDQIKKYYDCYLTDIDFTHGDATSAINRWFQMKTGGKITSFYDHPISEDVKLLFANTLTFNGAWDHQFPMESTKTETFTCEDGHQMQVSMMHKTDLLLYADIVDHKFQVVGIPFLNGEHYMYILMPHPGMQLMDMVGSIDYDLIQHILAHTVPQTVDLKMPIVSIDGHLQMKDTLWAMGIHKLFDSPDLDNMLAQPMSLKVAQIWHDAGMLMDEHGVDAWSGTAQEYKIYDQFVPNVDVKQFYVQKPFMFFIHHPSTKSILYYGSVHKVGTTN